MQARGVAAGGRHVRGQKGGWQAGICGSRQAGRRAGGMAIPRRQCLPPPAFCASLPSPSQTSSPAPAAELQAAAAAWRAHPLVTHRGLHVACFPAGECLATQDLPCRGAWAPAHSLEGGLEQGCAVVAGGKHK